jgi:hypothetical protein
VPQLLLVEQQIPGSKILPHVHGVDQFQVVIGGSGKLGQQSVGPVSLHYTNCFTAYGPIEAGPRGMSYSVLRPELAASGSHHLHLPEERAKMPRGGKRYFMADHLTVHTVDHIKSLERPQVDSRMPAVGDQADAGVFAQMLVPPPYTAYSGADPQSGCGRVSGLFWCYSLRWGMMASHSLRPHR